MDTKILEEIGLTAGEIKTYTALLGLGSSSTGPIAKESGVSRSKVYMILDRLEKKGLASHIEKSGVIYYQAAEPQKIKDYLSEKEETLEKLKKDLERVLPQFEGLQKLAGKIQKVTVYQGLKGMITAHEHTYMKLKRGEEYFYFGIPSYQPKEHHRYWKRDHPRRIRAGITCKLLFNRDTGPEVLKNRNSYKGCDARYMPPGIKTPAWFLGYKDVTVIGIAKENPIVIEITSQEVADSFLSYFEAFWDQYTYTLKGKEGIIEMCEEVLRTGKDVYLIGANGWLPFTHSDYFPGFEKRRVEAGITRHHVAIEETRGTPFSRLKKLKVRYLPKEFSSPMVIWVFGDYVAQVLWDEQIVFMTKNRKVANDYRKYFRFLWKNAKP
ncbi:MAG: hypothetical protein JSV39_01330 [Candidatus Aenigmatarchaeota archaeon]|nr:MAG: hypothetical protein JSV39_01330 [Candidatus Aenigmarchaeota archaeon]